MRLIEDYKDKQKLKYYKLIRETIKKARDDAELWGRVSENCHYSSMGANEDQDRSLTLLYYREFKKAVSRRIDAQGSNRDVSRSKMRSDFFDSFRNTGAMHLFSDEELAIIEKDFVDRNGPLA